jgi:hypothetical protein
VCDKEFNNAEELKLHKEQVHPMDEGEVPEMKDDNPEVKREKEDPEVAMPMPVERTR